MDNILNILETSTNLDSRYLVLLGLALGVFIFVLGAGGMMAGKSHDLVRMRRASVVGARGALDVLSRGDTNPTGILKVFVPTSKEERASLRKRLRQAGLLKPSALRNYYLVRTLLGALLPAVFVGLLFTYQTLPLPSAITQFLSDLDMRRTIILLSILLGVGFYGPALWLHSKIQKRRTEIEHGMPATLDLLQVAVEAGMGFDAAMNHVAHEIVTVCRPIAEEFMTVQMEIQAGMEREEAFMKMAERSGVDEMSSFVNVILQSAQFGTSISTALQTYADDMRRTRELRAQERANKLPVKMSAVMAAMMMPTLLMLTLTPVIIRFLRSFGA